MPMLSLSSTDQTCFFVIRRSHILLCHQEIRCVSLQGEESRAEAVLRVLLLHHVDGVHRQYMLLLQHWRYNMQEEASKDGF